MTIKNHDSGVMDYSKLVAGVALCIKDNNEKLFTELLGIKIRCNFCKKIVNKAVEAMRSDFLALVCPYCKELWIEWGLPGNKIKFETKKR